MGNDSNNLMQSYMVYSSILALKLLALSPIATLVCNPDKVRRAHLSDLKNLTPFWVVGALYVTTNPDKQIAMYLLRVYVVSRLVAALGYITYIPRMFRELAFFVSFSITCFMGTWVIYQYRTAI